MCQFDTPLYIYYSHITVFVLCLITAFLILMRNPKEASNRNAFYFIMLVAMWIADIFAQWMIHDVKITMIAVKFSVAAELVVLFFLYFSYHFVNAEINFKKKLLFSIPYIIIAAIAFFTNIFSYFSTENCDYVLGPIIYSALSINIIYAIWSSQILLKYYRNPSNNFFIKQQIRILIGAIWFYVLWNIFFESVGIVGYYLGSYIETTPHIIIGNLFFVSLIAFAIIKKDLFQFNTVLTTIFTIVLWSLMFLGLLIFPMSLGNIAMFAVFYAFLMFIFWKM